MFLALFWVLKLRCNGGGEAKIHAAADGAQSLWEGDPGDETGECAAGHKGVCCGELASGVIWVRRCSFGWSAGNSVAIGRPRSARGERDAWTKRKQCRSPKVGADSSSELSEGPGWLQRVGGGVGESEWGRGAWGLVGHMKDVSFSSRETSEQRSVPINLFVGRRWRWGAQ